MKRNINILAATAAIALCMMTGCGSISATHTSETTTGTAASATGTTTTASASGLSAVNLSATTDIEALFTERDLNQTPDTSSAEKITVSDGETIDITSAGVYLISGTASNCTIRVEADSADKVQLVLDGVNITNDSAPAIYIVNADKCFITTTDSENTLSVTGEFTADGDTNTNAVIFCKDDMVLNGTGTLTVSAPNGNGISGKDDLKVTGGTYNITCGNHAIRANDSVTIGGGTFDISAGKDGIHCENGDDDTVGTIIITDGRFDITAASDGIQGVTFVQIDGGTFDITSSEGIEATNVTINDGTINITATDDGINASPKSSAYDVIIEFNGGYTTINMGAGDTDGVDANGKVIVNGGTVSVNTSGNSFDYDTGKEFNGGTIIINGEEVDAIPEDMMAGFGGHGGFGGRPDFDNNGERPDFSADGERPEMPDMENMPEFPADGERPAFPGNGEFPEGMKRGGRGFDKSTETTESNSDSELPET